MMVLGITGRYCQYFVVLGQYRVVSSTGSVEGNTGWYLVAEVIFVNAVTAGGSVKFLPVV